MINEILEQANYGMRSIIAPRLRRYPPMGLELQT